jgi:hypothetical protein
VKRINPNSLVMLVWEHDRVCIPKISIKLHTEDRCWVMNSKALWLLARSDRRYELQQFRGFQYQEQAKSTVCYLYYQQMTTFHHTESSVSLFFRGYTDLSRNRLVSAVDIVLQSSFRNITNSSDTCKRNLFE